MHFFRRHLRKSNNTVRRSPPRGDEVRQQAVNPFAVMINSFRAIDFTPLPKVAALIRAGSLSIEFANSTMAPQKSRVSKKKFSATTSVGAARSIGR